MTTSEHERSEIEAAIERLVSGTPRRSTGALSIVQLAAEAGVKRWVLTHKHTDLSDEFRRRVATGGETRSAPHALEKRVTAAEAANQRLLAENAALRDQLRTYAQVIHELTIERSRTRNTVGIESLRRIT